MKHKKKIIGLFVLLTWLGTMYWQTHKPLPMGVRVDSSAVFLPESEVQFLTDLSFTTAQGQALHQQQIFDAVLQQIDTAQRFLVLDYFLLNDDMGSASQPLRKLSGEVAAHLLARKLAKPDIQILLITDPINDVYGGAPSELLQRLQAAGIDVVRTDLTQLRDSNAGYSAVWRGVVQWFGNRDAGGWLPNPFASEDHKITLRSYLSLLNFKANHRKVIVSDRADGEWQAIVASANPHDASSAHSNVALQFTGELTHVVLNSEINIAKMSGWPNDLTQISYTPKADTDAPIELSYVTESAIRGRIVREVNTAVAGDQIQLAMFYLSERDVLAALERAAQRQVSIRLILDPNKDAFGIQKDGVPNRPVANELVNSSNNITVRWYRTHGEQFHTKLLTVQHDGQLFVTLGSANFTRRNLDDYNLEANVALRMPLQTQLAKQFNAYFERLWQGDALTPEYTAPFGAYQDDSAARYWRYRLMEATGLSTF